MAHEIKKVTPDNVDFDPPLPGDNPRRRLPVKSFGVTDKALGLVEGNQFQRGVPTYEVTSFGPALRPETGPVPSIDRNPYNFVAFAGSQPWPASADPAGHDLLKDFNGFLEFEAEALTPCFVPAGFPYAPGNQGPGGRNYSQEDLRSIDRKFCTMRNGDGVECYAIPGASFKGALRSAVEALTNSRMGVADESYAVNPVYRRRVFTCGELKRAGNDWEVHELLPSRSGYGAVPLDNEAGLLAHLRAGKPLQRSFDRGSAIFKLSGSLVAAYQKNILEHPHYEEHYKDYSKEYLPLSADWRKELANVKVDDLIYCAVDPGTRQVVNFGKNVNYLWPAVRSLKDLCGAFWPREKPSLEGCKDPDPNKATDPADAAEHLFGFTSEHRDGRKPFRGLLSFETLWGPETSSRETQPVELAPLTSPASRGKSRPLYLAPRTDGTCASFDDPGVQVRGRKFYWHQPAPNAGIWPKHTFAGTAPLDKQFRQTVVKQCPPPVKALGAGTKFRGRIHLSNVSAHELGALLFALQGDGSFDPAFHLGKAKARGLGSFRIRVTRLAAFAPADRYASLAGGTVMRNLLPVMPRLISAFQMWCAVNARMAAGSPLSSHAHIRDFIQLHTWPGSTSFRYYPVNFSQYSWLPNDNDPAGEPKPPRRRPPAMSRARDLTP
ncbi:MAG: hypothetical protein ABJC09_09190 [Terriglobia bacterium]